MEYSKQDIDELIDKYLSGEATANEINILEQSYMKASKKISVHDVSDIDVVRINDVGIESWQGLIEKMNSNGARTLAIWQRIAVAASVVFVFGFGIYFYNQFTFRVKQGNQTLVSDVGPGGNKAYLTLGNGKRIVLSDGNSSVLAKDADVEIVKAANGQLIYATGAKKAHAPDLGYHTIETPKGGKYEITLPDGTRVWLNSASTLKYPASFVSLKERKVELKGEAYFEVAHNKAAPFRVRSAGQTIEVLGTHFNVNAYVDEDAIKTTLLEGSVKVSLNDPKDFKLLNPGEQADNSGNRLQISKVNVEQAIGWKNGDFVFKGEDVKSVMRQLARWYDVEIEYKGNVSDIGFVSTISKTKKLSEVITALQATEGVHFKIEGRRILVMP
ncbi:FecR family protein [Pedobacter nyackensis]|uniref:FecR family protein n=1 Tax=Pedobacter nyackensis TaxID=475255 RepID=UPI0029316820|nr:FecR domain-containing protein [Pedobacter nyackensis]